MDISKAAKALSALSQESRLKAFRLLVRSGIEGMAAGRIAASGENGRKLSALIAGLAPGKGIAPTGLRLDDGCQLMIIGISLPAHSHHDEAVAMLILSGTDSKPPMDTATLGQLFGLTPMEYGTSFLEF